MAFGARVMLVIRASPCPIHWWENVGRSEPNITSWLCRELYCVMYVGQVIGMEK